ncbi:capsular exopolysaccharide family [Ruminococcus sp. YE71]|uniref:CpsD/CapB family tyrosine-protein kinase n=1 Tax=unclassified Ruminococcus TaxID=2608920 RepID=UPI00088B1E47|nr:MULTISPECIES: CpsD/CapB family tyrosine-protein kinase [unclassified Ruminococcus]SDA25297.1 capsular exopolysaccharide family [Ruminococcus sp. YE78]SFW42698.1 capsular exopolysaccharide family [Ruminococcus sp. YE71]
MTTNNRRPPKRYFTLLDKELSFQATEAFKTLRTNLMFSLATKDSKAFAVTSSIQHEGKSTMTANLALTFVQMQAKVLLIDADLRKPTQQRLFKLKNKEGLSTLLAGLSTFRDVVCRDIIPGLDVLTSGPIPPNPSEMLGSERMKKMLSDLSSRYDYIIIDTPPINIVTDALTLSDSIAGVVLVAMSGVTTVDSYKQAVEAVEFANGTILGSVITNVPAGTGRHSYKNYGKLGYGYYGKKTDRPIDD